MVQIQCKACGGKQWIVGCDYRGMDGRATDYEHETHECRGCGKYRSSWKVLQKGPPFLVLSQEQLAALGEDWSPPPPPPEPPLPPPPLFVMRDQGSSLSYAPTLAEAREWLGYTRPGEFLRVDHRDAGSLRVDLVAPARYTLTCVDAKGSSLATSEGHDLDSTLAALKRYLASDVKGTVALVRGKT
jgi:hypothetical protein